MIINQIINNQSYLKEKKVKLLKNDEQENTLLKKSEGYLAIHPVFILY